MPCLNQSPNIPEYCYSWPHLATNVMACNASGFAFAVSLENLPHSFV
jgi:hypothetical protein